MIKFCKSPDTNKQLKQITKKKQLDNEENTYTFVTRFSSDYSNAKIRKEKLNKIAERQLFISFTIFDFYSN